MSLFVIADLHLSTSVDKPMDIFGGWDNYMERLEENWQRLVAPEDTVVIPGDISWGMNLSQCRSDFDFIDGNPCLLDELLSATPHLTSSSSLRESASFKNSASAL